MSQIQHFHYSRITSPPKYHRFCRASLTKQLYEWHGWRYYHIFLQAMFDQEIYIWCIEIAPQSQSESTIRGHSEWNERYNYVARLHQWLQMVRSKTIPCKCPFMCVMLFIDARHRVCQWIFKDEISQITDWSQKP